jgi:hypothetical protein
LICPGYQDKPKVTAKLRLLDQDTWEGAPSLSTEESGYWIFDENFFLTKGGQPCPPGTYGIELAVEFRSAPANSLGRFLRASLKIQVHDPRSKPERTLEIDGEGLSIINLQGHDLRGFSHVKLKGGDKSVVNLHRGAADSPPQSADSPPKPSTVDRYYQLPLKVDHDRTDVVFHEAVRQSRDFTACVTAVPYAILPGPLFVFRVSEHVTSSSASVRSVIAAVEYDVKGTATLLSDWQLIERLNALLKRRTLRRDSSAAQLQDKNSFEAMVRPAASMVKDHLERLDVSFVVPDVQLLAMICPSSTDSSLEDSVEGHEPAE